MNDQSPINNDQPELLDRREARRLRRETRHAGPGASSSTTWIVGVILIFLGAVFLLQNMGNFTFPLRNWWSLFILIPAIGAFERAFRLYRDAGNQLTAAVRSALLGGLVLVMVVAAFLLDLSWTIFGPVLIILAGVGILVNAMLSGKE